MYRKGAEIFIVRVVKALVSKRGIPDYGIKMALGNYYILQSTINTCSRRVEVTAYFSRYWV
ncbi:hypothetical protein GCM10009425_40330 [Pseudomonas asuensis]|uniref:Uncharacterized protein n=1 Tax=Pseudomonas asuensis TaxID=1825787 RepID=A0ABQ2H166_9PSED|nr:hypothetical protein GCM10009425_40330 [Pseudomonas asuensis]